jgi:hypothetical protein
VTMRHEETLGFGARAVLVAMVVAGLACGSENDPPNESSVYEPELIAMPAKAMEKCLKGETLRPVCPGKLPRIELDTFHTITAPRADWPVFSAEWSAPSPKLAEKNAPPRFTHLVVQAEHRDMFPFKWPSKPHPQSSAIKDKRKEALLLDTPTWGEIEGALVLAPSYPFGGIDGDHLIFRWEQAGKIYALSLHAWRPLNESIATLRAVVASIP